MNLNLCYSGRKKSSESKTAPSILITNVIAWQEVNRLAANGEKKHM